MTKIAIALWNISMTFAWANGPFEAAYYLGKFSPEYWQQEMLSRSQDEGAGDPFAEGAESELVEDFEETVIAVPALGKAPFESRFFRQGDVLQDLTRFVQAYVVHSGTVGQAVWNETSRRVVLKGDEMAHRYMKNFVESHFRDQARMIQLTVKFFEAPKKSCVISHWESEDFSTQGSLLGEVSLIAKPGQKAAAKSGSPGLEVSWEPNVGQGSDIIDARLDFSGMLGSNRFHLKTGLTTFDGLSRCLELGEVGQNGKAMILSLTQEIVFMGGVLKRNVILDANGKGTDPKKHLGSLLQGHSHNAIIDPGTGKAFRAFSVPPTLLSFLGGGDNDMGEGDPFAEDDEFDLEQEALIAKQTFLKSWDAKVVASSLDRLVDLKKYLKMQGVKFSDSDFAVFNVDSNMVFVEASPMQMELVEAIIGGG